jgi:hypothetical protein
MIIVFGHKPTASDRDTSMWQLSGVRSFLARLELEQRIIER